ncbi:MAG: nicotinate (nicotinamide) nucleotide adenylyltransferase [Lactimicrobium massiliense]|nr:nicotinate (nicotinamide) nucleotide adenylyltransferase [Lactimicrobium massiliense]MDD6230973.1 nicotinate (nicotinamide) nucleotide adenylyltransferase [Lactimicrobium massiliense]MDD6559971.1 nicotinate (nicotinamide) nucleotide adenylyltransferase [Lactimicrobium massiliense]
MEVLAFFGAFNPPTIAHINLAKEAMEKCGLEKVIFVPSQDSYVREVQQKSFSFSNSERKRMLAKIAASRPWMLVDDEELSMDHQPRTYDTLCSLKKKGYHAHLLMGSDKLKELQTGWKHVKEIVHEFGIVCMSRSQDDAAKMIQNDPYLSSLSDGIQVISVDTEYRDISSTKARQLFLILQEPGSHYREADELKRILPAELNGLRDYL